MKKTIIYVLMIFILSVQMVYGQSVTITPSSASICAGSGTFVSLTAPADIGGDPIMSYNWTASPISMGLYTNQSLNVSPIANNTYTVTVVTLGGFTYTGNATITVNSGPTPTVTPGVASFCVGSSVLLTSSHSGQWYKNGAIITGAIGASYSATSAGSYSVFVTVGGCSGESSSVVVSTNPLPDAGFSPNILLDECPGSITPFTANLIDYANCTYQWYRSVNTMESSNIGTPISGATSATYTPSAIIDAGTYNFSLKITNTTTGCVSKW